jgi:hypothetical protein
MICIKCKTDKNAEEFYDRRKTDSNAGRKKSACKSCQLARNRKSNALRRLEHRDKLRAIKLKQGCADCGFKAYAQVLHFHHRKPEDKKFPIAHSLLYSWNTILGEIKKCEVLCSLCHIIRHQNGC